LAFLLASPATLAGKIRQRRAVALGWTPAVSVLVPCFNLGEYLPEAVESVFAQTRQDFEIIVVNDGSTEAATNALLARFRRPRTLVLNTENRGLAAARNLAIEHARGRYLCALDADDKLHPAFFERTLGLLDADPTLTFASTWLELFGAESWTWRQDRCDLPALLRECVVLTASPVRREAVLAVGGYDTSIFGGRYQGHEDWDLWISLVERGYRGTIVPEVLFQYRRRPGSMYAACHRGEVRERLLHALIDKHRASYLAHAREILLHRERECGDVLRANSLLERELESELRPRLERARAQLEARRGPMP
jgi:glycosyltransferase involved in cell wall biosynthesis